MSGKDKGKNAARARAARAVAAERAGRLHQRHILDLGDRAVEVVAGDQPGVWHAVVDGTRGPAMLETGRLDKAAAGRSGRPEHADMPAVRPAAAGARVRPVAAAGHGPYPSPAPVPVPGRELSPMEEYRAVLGEPAGLSSAELERLVPDRAPGTCLSCRLPLTARDGTEKCAWCLALHNLKARPSPVTVLRPAWPCTCGCPSQAAHQIRTGIMPVRMVRYRSPGRALASVIMAVFAWYVAYHLLAPFIIAVIVFTALAIVHMTGKRRPRP